MLRNVFLLVNRKNVLYSTIFSSNIRLFRYTLIFEFNQIRMASCAKKSFAKLLNLEKMFELKFPEISELLVFDISLLRFSLLIIIYFIFLSHWLSHEIFQFTEKFLCKS